MTEMTEEMETLLTLIGALAPERGPWTMNCSGAIRNAQGECPICAAAHVVLDTRRYTNLLAICAANDALGCGHDDATLEVIHGIMKVADGSGDPEITKRLRAMLRVA
jgi:hypothetical protein